MCQKFSKAVTLSSVLKIVPTFSNDLRFNVEDALFDLDDIQLDFKSLTFPRSVRFDFNGVKFAVKSVCFGFKGGQFDLNVSILM